MTQRIYTRTGDSGDTGLFGGGRVPKTHPRVEAYGAVDELNAAIGWAITTTDDGGIRTLLADTQADLFAIGAHLATPAGPEHGPWLPRLPTERVQQMESWIDAADAELPRLRAFILPGGTPAAAALHLARTICRRAERRVVALAADAEVDPGIIVYLNRLSDALFTAARLANLRAGHEERRWEPRSRDSG